MSSDIKCERETLPGACGVAILVDFHRDCDECKSVDEHLGGGAEWLCSGFVENSDKSTEAFQDLCAKYKLVFRTPTRLNRNSMHQFYFAVFDTTKGAK